MTPEYLKSLSKFLSLVLRHKPEVVGIQLDRNGWADVDELIEGAIEKGKELDLPILEAIVAQDEKQRYSFNEDKTKIRANQGHSVKVDLDLEAVEPPRYLYHGAEELAMERIMRQGLVPRQRNHVQLSEDPDTAVETSEIKGHAVIFKVFALAMHRKGFTFYQAANGVWLTENVPNTYLDMY